MMFQLPPLKVNLPKPKYKNQEVTAEHGQKAQCKMKDTFLDMSQLSLVSFPAMVLRCEQLHTLILNRNFLRAIPAEIRLLDGLEVLDLSYNKLYEFPKQILSLKSLTDLDISHNVLQNIAGDIRILRRLTTVNLSNNRIRTLPVSMQHLSSLASLDVSSNKLEAYPLDLCNCFNKLTKLKCSYNLITVVPYEIIYLAEGCLVDKKAVDFTHNPLSFPPIDVVSRGFEAMRDFIEPKWREQKEFKRRKNVLCSTKTNITKQNLWEKEDTSQTEEFSKTSSAPVKKKRHPQPPTRRESPNPKKTQVNNNSAHEKTGAKTPKSAKRGRANSGGKKKKSDKLADSKRGESYDDSSQATLVEVYAGPDTVTPVNQLSPLPDSWHQSKTPGVEGELLDLKGSDDDDEWSNYNEGEEEEAELVDITQSFEPPDLDVPDTMSMGTGGGMLEQWLGAVQSMTQSPTTQDPSCGSTDGDGSCKVAFNPFTPFSDVKITKNKEGGSTSSEDEDHDIPDMAESTGDPMYPDSRAERSEVDSVPPPPITPHSQDTVSDLVSCRNSLSTPDPIFTGNRKDDLPPKPNSSTTPRPKRNSVSRGRRGSVQSLQSTISLDTVSKAGKKKKRKKKKKKVKKEESELEFYSRIPFQPLLISRRQLPNFWGLKTWAYFTEPKSCYLIDNMTEISSSTKRVRFGTDEVTVMKSNSSTRSLLTESCIAVNSSNSSLDRTNSMHSVDSNNSQLLSGSVCTMSQRSDISSKVGGGDGRGTGPPLLSPSLLSERRGVTSPPDSASVTGWSKSNITKNRPSSLPAPRHHTWTSEDLQKYIYKPPDLIIPPKVLISYLKHETDTVQLKQIHKLANTLESNGLAECVCDLLPKNDYDFEELGFFDWLNEQVQECEFVILIMSEYYIRSLPLLNKLASSISKSSSPYRNSPYITPADIKRWGMGLNEVQRKFIPVFYDDMEITSSSTWVQVLPFYIPSEICELGYHLISRDSRESVIIPNIFDMEDTASTPDMCDTSKADIVMTPDSSTSSDQQRDKSMVLSPDMFRVLPVTAHLVVIPQDIPPDWRLEEIAGKIRHYWKDFAQTCGFDKELIEEIDSVYSGMLNKSIKCLYTWKGQLVGNASYEELARRLDQIDQKHIADAYCNFQRNF